MRKIVVAVNVLMLFYSAHSQRNYSLSGTANFDFLTNGLGANDDGVGFSVLSNVFTKKRIQLKVDASLDHCFGDKILIMDSLGNNLPSSATLVGLRLGPECFVTDKISLSALYGYTTYHVYGDKNHSGSYKLAITSYLGKNKRTLFAVSFSKLTGTYSFVHFCGISIGSRIL